MAKTICPLTREQFLKSAPRLVVPVRLNGEGEELKEFKADPRNFSTGSMGWNVNDKMNIEVDGKLLTIQVGMNLTVIGSKDLP